MTHKNDQGRIEKANQRYYKAAHRIQTAIAYHPDRPTDPYKDLRTGVDMSKSDMAGLAKLLMDKRLFSLAEYVEALAKSAEDEAKQKEDELSVRFGINVRTL